MDPARKLALFEALVGHRHQGNRGRLSFGLGARLRVRAPHHRRRPDPRGRDSAGAGPVPPRADRADFRSDLGRAREPSSTSTTRRPSCSGGWCSARTAKGSSKSPRTRPGCAKNWSKRCTGPSCATSTRPRASPVPKPTLPSRFAQAVADVIEPTAGGAPRHQSAVHSGNVHPQRVRRRHRVVRPPAQQPGSHRPVRAPPQRPGHRGGGGRAGHAGWRRPPRGHAVRQRRADRATSTW